MPYGYGYGYNNRQYGSYPQRGYSRQYNGGYQQQPRKHSGARIKDGKNGKPVITAWKKSRFSFTTLVACPNNGKNITRKDGKPIVNSKGQEYARWTATIVDRSTGTVSTHSALYNLSTGKLYITDLKLVASPKAPNGGYFGKSYVSRNHR